MLFRLRSFFFFFFEKIQPRFKRNFVSRIDSSRIHRSLCTLSRWNRIELTGSHFRGCFSLCFSAVFSRLGPSRVISFRVTLFDTTLYRHGSLPLSISWQSYYIVAGEQANNASFMERKSFQFRRDSKLFFFFFFYLVEKSLHSPVISLPWLPSSVPIFSARGRSRFIIVRHERTVIAVYIGGKSSLPPRIILSRGRVRIGSRIAIFLGDLYLIWVNMPVQTCKPYHPSSILTISFGFGRFCIDIIRSWNNLL